MPKRRKLNWLIIQIYRLHVLYINITFWGSNIGPKWKRRKMNSTKSTKNIRLLRNENTVIIFVVQNIEKWYLKYIGNRIYSNYSSSGLFRSMTRSGRRRRKNFSQNQKEASDERCLVKIGWNFEKNYYHQEQDSQKSYWFLSRQRLSKESVSFQFSSASQCILKSGFHSSQKFSVVAGSKWRLVFVHTTKKEKEARVFKMISNCLKALFPFSI